MHESVCSSCPCFHSSLNHAAWRTLHYSADCHPDLRISPRCICWSRLAYLPLMNAARSPLAGRLCKGCVTAELLQPDELVSGIICQVAAEPELAELLSSFVYTGAGASADEGPYLPTHIHASTRPLPDAASWPSLQSDLALLMRGLLLATVPSF